MEEEKAAQWLRMLFAPLLSAIVTGGIMYVGVRVEVSAISTRQEMVLRMLDNIQTVQMSQQHDTALMRERLAVLEERAKSLK